MKIGNIKKEVTHDMENLGKKNDKETQNTVEGHSSRLEKQKTESQNLKMEWKLKEKLKNCYSKNSKPVKGICKNSPKTSKDQT
jgi:hypothetical protein